MVYVEEAPKQSHWVDRNKRTIIVCTLLILIPMSTVSFANWFYWYQYQLNPELDPTYSPSHNLTVWIAPDDEEFHLHIDFYGSESNLYAGVNRFCGLGIRVEPFDDEVNHIHLYTLPEDIVHVWIKVYFEQDLDAPFVVERVDLGMKMTTQLLGREISILIEPYQV